MSAVATFLVFALIFWLAPAYLVYVHANNRGRDAGLWAAVVLVGGLLGILLYFILAGSGESRGPTHGQGDGTRGRASGAHGQSGGGHDTPYSTGGGQAGSSWDTAQPQGNSQGSDSWQSSPACPQCGATIDHLANYCSNCGASLE